MVNTANLQLEGLLLALASLLETMRRKELVTQQDIDQALDIAAASTCAEERSPLSGANLDAIHFPIRFLKAATRLNSGVREASFAELAAIVGETKPKH
jgi:hypothetical protein